MEKPFKSEKTHLLEPLDRQISEEAVETPRTPTEETVGFSAKTLAGLSKKPLFPVSKDVSAQKLKLPRSDKIFFLDAF